MSTARASTDAAALREAFDRSFSAAPAQARQGLDAGIAIQIGSDVYAIRLAEIAGMQVDRKITPVPSSDSSLLGIVAVRGVLAPAYDLRVLLGYAAGHARRWLLFANTAHGLTGLVFDRFDAHLKLERESGSARDEHARPHVRGQVQTLKGSLPLLDLNSVVSAILRP